LFVDYLADARVIVIKVVDPVTAREIKMGFRKPMDYHSVQHQIYMAGVELYSPRNDGYVQFEIKKDLYKLKWLLDAMMKDSPEFAGEEEFVTEHEKTVMWRTLTK
jgi:hypothetical protein